MGTTQPRTPTVRRRWARRTVIAGLLGVALAVASSAGATAWLRDGADGHLYAEPDVPAAAVALVLGTRVHDDGTPSAFLVARLELARRLHSAGKVRTILVSGAARPDDGYDEPAAMRRWLVERGVPADQVVVDPAGFDTYDSCARARRVYEVRQAIVVTQSFHLPRAVTLCRRLGVDAVGVGDESVRVHERTWSVGSTREYGAAVKAALDVLSGRDPRVL